MTDAQYLTSQEVRANTEFLRRLGSQLIGDSGAVEDAVQDAWLAVLVRPPTGPGALRSWWKSVVANIARNRHRGRRRRDERERHAAKPEVEPPSTDLAEKEEMFRLLSDALLELPRPMKEVVFLRYFEGLAPSDVAAQLGVPVSTAKSRLRRALRRLRSRLGHEMPGAWRTNLAALVGCGHAVAPAKTATALASVGVVTMSVKSVVMISVAVMVVAILGVWSLQRSAHGPSGGGSETEARIPASSVADETGDSAAALTAGIETVPFQEAPDAESGDGGALLVAVHDSHGVRQVGFPVSLRAPSKRHQGRTSTRTTATEPPAGLAVFPLRNSNPGRATVFCDLPAVDPPQAQVDLGGPPTEPVILTLPPTGSLRILVRDASGIPIIGRTAKVKLHVQHPAASPGRWGRPSLDGAGSCVLPWVGLGLRFELVVSAPNPQSPENWWTGKVEGPGPTTEGEEAVLRVVVDCGRSRVVTGCLVHSDGSPLPACGLEAKAIIDPRPAGLTLLRVPVTDGGRFRLEVEHPYTPGGLRIYEIFDRNRPDGDVLRASIDLSRPLPRGETDVGVVVLGRGLFLVGGMVSDRNGQPVAGLHVAVMRKDPIRDRFAGVQGLLGQKTGVDGAFAIYLQSGEEVPDGEYELGVIGEETVRIGFRPGDRNVNVVLSPQQRGRIAGSITLESKANPGDYKIAVVVGSSRWCTVPMRDGSFESGSIRAGKWPVLILPRSADARSDEALTRVDGVTIEAGKVSRDPRLQGMRVPPGRLLAFTLEIVDAKGAPVEAFVSIDNGDKTPPQTSSGGAARIAVLGHAVDLLISKEGYRTLRLTGVNASRRVTLSRGIHVRFTTDAQARGENPRWLLGLSFGKHAVPEEHGLFTVDRRPLPFTSDGKCDLFLPGPGVYRPVACVFVPTVGEPWGVPIRGLESSVINVVEQGDIQTFEIAIPDEALRRALDEVFDKR